MKITPDQRYEREVRRLMAGLDPLSEDEAARVMRRLERMLSLARQNGQEVKLRHRIQDAIHPYGWEGLGMDRCVRDDWLARHIDEAARYHFVFEGVPLGSSCYEYDGKGALEYSKWAALDEVSFDHYILSANWPFEWVYAWSHEYGSLGVDGLRIN